MKEHACRDTTLKKRTLAGRVIPTRIHLPQGENEAQEEPRTLPGGETADEGGWDSREVRTVVPSGEEVGSKKRSAADEAGRVSTSATVLWSREATTMRLRLSVSGKENQSWTFRKREEGKRNE